ncbi:MAG: glycosyltransferase family 4 protein [Halobacteriota archaeon]
MKICLIGDFSVPDEARKVMAHQLLRTISYDHSVEVLDLAKWASVDGWRRIKLFAPDIVHYVPGASTFSFLFTRALQAYLGNDTKTVTFSALNTFPGFSSFSYGPYYALSWLTKGAIPFIKTDLVLVQSDHAEQTYRALRCKVKYAVYSGVDLERFRPIAENDKQELKREYGIDPEKFVVLHVGSVRKWRNVSHLANIQKEPDTQVVLVGRATTKNEKDVEQALRRIGMVVTDGYDPNIEKFYGLADCYVFPTTTVVGSIDVPLSVLEAMAHNLPVVSTRFGGLPRMFGEGNGFFYSDTASFDQTIQTVKEGGATVATRQLVTPYSWENIANNLCAIYQELVHAC